MIGLLGLFYTYANNGQGNVEVYACKVTAAISRYSDQINALVSLTDLTLPYITTHFNFSLITTAFDGGNVPAIAVQRLEVAA